MATKLSELITTTPRSSSVEVPCGMACGRVVRDWVLVTARGVGMLTIDESKAGEEKAENIQRTPYALEVRVCSPCFGLWMHVNNSTAKDIDAAHRKRG